MRFLALLALLLLAAPVEAHFVKSNSGIGAVLHIDPGDDPIAGKESTIFLEFKDTEGRFRLSDCECNLTVFKEDAEISSLSFGAVSKDEQLSASIPFTFPEKNIYKLKVTGKPLSPDRFSEFELEYDVRVAKENVNSADLGSSQESWFSEHLVHLIGGFVIVGFLIFALIKQHKDKRNV